MKKILFTVVAVLGVSAFTVLQAQDLETLKKQRESVKFKLDLIDKKIELEKAIADKDKREVKAQDLNEKADSTGGDFSENSSAEKATDEAKAAAKALRKAENANKSLARSRNRIIDLEGDIRKLESKLESARYEVELREK